MGITETLLAIHDLMLCLAFLRGLPELANQQLYLYGGQEAGVASLYAALCDDGVAGVIADSIPVSHLQGAYLPGILWTLDIPHLTGLVAPRPVGLVSFGVFAARWASRLYHRLGCPERLIEGPLAHVLPRVLSSDDSSAEVSNRGGRQTSDTPAD